MQSLIFVKNFTEEFGVLSKPDDSVKINSDGET